MSDKPIAKPITLSERCYNMFYHDMFSLDTIKQVTGLTKKNIMFRIENVKAYKKFLDNSIR